jgi:protein-disulfide isomerase
MQDTSSGEKINQPSQKTKWYKRWWGIILSVFGATLLVILLIFGGLVTYYYYQIKSGQKPLPPSAKFSKTNLSTSAPEKIDPLKILQDGEPNSAAEAPLTIVGFFDFECPFSKEASGIMRELQATYGEKINFVFRNFPLSDIHPNAIKAARAGECANLQDKFWPMHDKLFTSSDFSDETLELYAKQIGLDEIKFADCLSSDQSNGLVLKDLVDGQALGIRGTPTWFIDNQKIEGLIPTDAFGKIFDYLLAKIK